MKKKILLFIGVLVLSLSPTVAMSVTHDDAGNDPYYSPEYGAWGGGTGLFECETPLPDDFDATGLPQYGTPEGFTIARNEKIIIPNHGAPWAEGKDYWMSGISWSGRGNPNTDFYWSLNSEDESLQFSSKLLGDHYICVEESGGDFRLIDRIKVTVIDPVEPEEETPQVEETPEPTPEPEQPVEPQEEETLVVDDVPAPQVEDKPEVKQVEETSEVKQVKKGVVAGVKATKNGAPSIFAGSTALGLGLAGTYVLRRRANNEEA